MAKKTFYEILEVDAKAPLDQIRASYHKLAAQFHPDKWIGVEGPEKVKASKMIRKLNEAFSVVSRKERRKLYDDCLVKGINFYEAEEFSKPETEAEREVREAVSQHFGDALKKTTDHALETFQTVFDLVRWKNDPPDDPYFDRGIVGQAGSHRFRVLFKTLAELTAQDFPGICLLYTSPSPRD